jgi:Complex 1 protein (LYR family)
MAGSLRKEVFVLYKRILRLGTTWKAADPNRTSEERKYIIEEAKFWFRKNSHIADMQAIQDHIREGEARYEMGQ